jgi:phosphoglycolate phosphatase-like HAD superfamily hydrolase
MRMLTAILFDVDGTLVDSNELHAAAWHEAFAHFDIEIPVDAIRGQIGKGGDNLIPALLPDLDDRKRDEIDDYRSLLFKRDYLPRVVPFAGVRALFERLYGDGVRIVLASSSGADEVSYHLDLIGCRDLVFATTSADEADHSKPDPDIFNAALAKVARAEASEALVVGDTPYDLEAAAKAGIRAVALRCGGFPDAALGGASAIYDGPADLLANYEAWTG